MKAPREISWFLGGSNCPTAAFTLFLQAHKLLDHNVEKTYNSMNVKHTASISGRFQLFETSLYSSAGVQYLSCQAVTEVNVIPAESQKEKQGIQQQV